MILRLGPGRDTRIPNSWQLLRAYLLRLSERTFFFPISSFSLFSVARLATWMLASARPRTVAVKRPTAALSPLVC